jgi:hypothetical protein
MTRSLPLWVYAEVADFRLGIDCLALKAQASLGPQRAFSAAHVFFNRSVTRSRCSGTTAMAGG